MCNVHLKNINHFSSLIIRLLFRYEIVEDALLAVPDLIEDTITVKENVNPLNNKHLGLLVKEIWGDKVKLVKRGPRGQRRSFYLNLKRKAIIPDDSFEGSLELCCDREIKLPDSWIQITDRPNKISFVRHEKWTFKKQRVTTELSINISDSSELSYTISSHGCEIDIGKDIKIVDLHSRPLKDQVHTILAFLEHSTICQGISLAEDEALVALLPHESGSFQDLRTTEPKTSEVRAFSSSCQVLTSSGNCCVTCSHLRHVDNRRKKRKLERASIHPATNKRYLTKEEVIVQLAQERNAKRNAENREKYWREKFMSEAIEMETEDHEDLSAIWNSLPKDNIPEDMKCLWEQQNKLTRTKKNGYRWHPK